MNKLSNMVASLDPKKRALLAALLQEDGGEASRALVLRAPRTGDRFPLSFAQERLWFLDRLWPGDISYNLPAAMRLEGRLDTVALAGVFAEIGRRHEALRTRFAEHQGQPLQVIETAQAAPVLLPVVDLQLLPAAAREAEAGRLTAQHSSWSFDLASAPLLRVLLLRLGPESHGVLFNMHHIISDGWSFGVLTEEVGILYESLAGGRPSPLPPLELQYVDYAVWQRTLLQGAELERQVEYWRRQLAGAPPLLELPTDRPRPASPSFRGGQAGVALPAAVRDGLAALCRRTGTTLFMALLAAFFTLLRRYTGQDDLVVGTPIAGRHNTQLEKLIGLFVNSLVLRCSLAGDPPFTELLGRVQRAALGAYDHQDLPFEKLVEALQPERSLAHQPLFQLLFALQNVPQRTAKLSTGLQMWGEDPGSPTSKLDLSVLFNEMGEGLVGGIEYSADLFDAPTIQALGERFRTLVDAILEDPERRLSGLPLLPAAERQQILHEWNDTARPASAAGPFRLLHETVEEQARQRPAAAAVALDGVALSYAELNARANQLARFLRSRGIAPGDRVGLLLERSVDAVAAILGTLKAGAAYVPLDPAYPPARLGFLAADSGLSLLLTRGATDLELAAPQADLEQAREEIGRQVPGDLDLGLPLPSGSLAYVIYTSGSTGRPKGVAVPHGGVLNVLEHNHRLQPLPPGAVHATWGSFSFDLSVQEVFLAFREGGRLEIVPERLRADGPGLAAWLAEKGVESAWVAPALLPDLHRFASGPAAGLRLRRLLTGVEPASEALLARIARRLPGLGVQDGYGPTEASILATLYAFGGAGGGRDPGEAPDRDTPLGRPIPGVRVQLRGHDGELVPAGVPGELCIAGAGLAWGYLGRPDLTAERYRPDPASPEAGGRLYHTGDLARWRPDGNLEYLGRVDHQVKLRGFRIELGEIEGVLASHPAVEAAAAVVRASPAPAPVDIAGGTLLAFAVLRPEAVDASPSHLLAFLRERLPAPFVPAVVVLLPELPRTPNGKVDRAALARVEAGAGGEAFVPPRTPVEEVLAAIWAAVLGLSVARIGAHDNFFELSGHSLLATQVAFRVREAFGVELPLRRLFERATLAELAREIEAAAGATPGSAERAGITAQAGEAGRTAPAGFLQEWMWKLQGGPVNAAYNMPSPLRARGGLDLAVLRRALTEIVRRHESLRTRFHFDEAGEAGEAGGLLQTVQPAREAPLPLVDLTGLPETLRDGEMSRLAVADALRPFDLTAGYPLRLTVVRRDPRDQALLFNLHHIVSDGWSMEVLQNEIGVLYGAFSRGEPSPLPELAVQYADYAEWQRRQMAGEEVAAHLESWTRRLADLPPAVGVPGDRPGREPAGHQAVETQRLLEGEGVARLQAAARQAGCTPTMAVLAGLEALLYTYTRQEDMIVGSMFSGRDRPELSDLIGLFLNPLPIRTRLDGAPSFRELMLRVRESSLWAYARQDVPLPLLLAGLFPDRVPSRTLVFRVLFNMLSFPVPAPVPAPVTTPAPASTPEPVAEPEQTAPPLHPLTFEAMPTIEGNARYDLVIEAREGPGFLQCKLIGAADLYDPATLERVADDFAELLERAGAAPDTRIDQLLTAPRHQPAVQVHDHA